jgi:hypothetical protein
MGNPEVLSLLVRARKGDTIGSTKRAKKVLTGCIGSRIQDNNELRRIAQDKIFKNQITLYTKYLKT